MPFSQDQALKPVVNNYRDICPVDKTQHFTLKEMISLLLSKS